ncbi:MAG TPA: tetratricopeptide repeat protein [Opitutaceae bacterium]|nr:tetratricopeptide repeat protein [Opitutaceae bacterium]
MNTAPRQSPSRWWKRGWLLALVLVVATLVAYRPAWNGEAVYDDNDHLTPPELSGLEGLAKIWSELGAVSQYYPITHSAFWLQQHLWGDAMLGYHLVNILLHAVAALLLGRLLQRLEVPGAWLAAAIFALHPVHAESVAWISELKNTLSGVFYFGAALLYLGFDETRRKKLHVAALVLFGIGLLAKAVIASLPAALLVVFWWKRGSISWKRDVVPLLPFFALGIIAGLFVAWMERKFIGAEGEAFAFSFVERCLIAGRAVWFYAGKLLWPADLVFIYPRWQVSAAVWWQHVFPVALLLFAAALWARHRRARGPLAALLFFAGTLFPVLGFLNVYPFVYSFVADHYQYLASAGLLTAAAVGIASLLNRAGCWGRPVGNALCAALLLVLATMTWRQSRMYGDVETLWRTTIERNPACFVAHSNLGNHLLDTGRVDEAIHHGLIALRLQPGFAEIHNNLGNALRQKGSDDEALGHYRKAVELRPTLAEAHFNIGAILLKQGRGDDAMASFQSAVELRPEFVRARNNLGTILLEKGQVEEAIRHFEAALQTRRDDPEVHNNLGNALLRQGRTDDAIIHYRHALKQGDDLVATHHNLGMLFFQKGRAGEAVSHFQRIAELQPGSATAHNNLGWILRVTGRLDPAITHLQKALELRPDYPEAHNNLGKALFEKGQVREAIPHYRTALNLQPDNLHAMANLAWALATSPDASVRSATEALELALRANQLSGGNNAAVLQSLAAAYAEAGRFSDAVSACEQALQVAGPDSPTTPVTDLRAQLRLYQNGLPYRGNPAKPPGQSAAP